MQLEMSDKDKDSGHPQRVRPHPTTLLWPSHLKKNDYKPIKPENAFTTPLPAKFFTGPLPPIVVTLLQVKCEEKFSTMTQVPTTNEEQVLYGVMLKDIFNEVAKFVDDNSIEMRSVMSYCDAFCRKYIKDAVEEQARPRVVGMVNVVPAAASSARPALPAPPAPPAPAVQQMRMAVLVDEHKSPQQQAVQAVHTSKRSPALKELPEEVKKYLAKKSVMRIFDSQKNCNTDLLWAYFFGKVDRVLKMCVTHVKQYNKKHKTEIEIPDDLKTHVKIKGLRRLKNNRGLIGKEPSPAAMQAAKQQKSGTAFKGAPRGAAKAVAAVSVAAVPVAAVSVAAVQTMQEEPEHETAETEAETESDHDDTWMTEAGKSSSTPSGA